MHASKPPHIGAIFIAYNAERTLERFYQAFPTAQVQTIILVDDASTDNTYELARALGIQSYRNPVNLGYGGNLKRALSIALEVGMDIIIDIHPDGEYDASAIPPAIEAIQRGADFVVGNRFTTITEPIKSGMYWWKLFPILFLNMITRRALNVPLNDLHQGFRVYTRKMLSAIDYTSNSNSYLFSFELVAQAAFAGLKIAQVPVQTHYTGTKRGASLKNSFLYTLGVFKVLVLFLSAHMGLQPRLFSKVLSPRK